MGARTEPIRQWMGDSRGRWEGNTLVVDTVNFNDKASFRGSDGNLHLVERFTRIDRDTIEYQVTVEDPTVWTQSWTALIPMRATTGLIYEFACHEGNARSVEGILGSAAPRRQSVDRYGTQHVLSACFKHTDGPHRRCGSRMCTKVPPSL